jgi:N-acetylmuramoyl-L-alanine amidase CwlA
MKPVNRIITNDRWSIKCPFKMDAEGITVHNTANDASALNEIGYMARNNNQVSFHYAIDDKHVVQGIPEDRNAWHAGDGREGNGNRTTIAIEICYSKSGGPLFDASEKLAAKFIASILARKGWGIERVHTHQKFSGKNCPHRTLELGWARFLDMIRGELKMEVLPDWERRIRNSGFSNEDEWILKFKQMLDSPQDKLDPWWREFIMKLK